VSQNVKIKIYKTMILPMVLYGCETLSVKLKEDHGLSENRVLRIFGPKGDEVMGGRRKVHFNEELRDLYFSPSINRLIKLRRMRWAGHVAQMEEKKNAYRLLVGKRPLRRPRCRWVDNIKIDLRETGWCGVEWIGPAQGTDKWRALVKKARTFSSGCTTSGSLSSA
jgi:hypothetical protein